MEGSLPAVEKYPPALHFNKPHEGLLTDMQANWTSIVSTLSEVLLPDLPRGPGTPNLVFPITTSNLKMRVFLFVDKEAYLQSRPRTAHPASVATAAQGRAIESPQRHCTGPADQR